MDKTLIIKELINHYSNGKNVEFAKLLGVKPQTINSWIARNTFDIELIYAKCELIDANWLLTGEGEMLKPKVQDQPVSPSSQCLQSTENQCKDNENNPILAETSENIKSLIGILNRTLIEKDKQIESLLSIIKQNGKL